MKEIGSRAVAKASGGSGGVNNAKKHIVDLAWQAAASRPGTIVVGAITCHVWYVSIENAST